MKVEQILNKIQQDCGKAVFGNSAQLLGLFADYSRGQMKPQANALRVFLDCGGNERVLKLQNASANDQQIELHRLIQEMVSQYNMREDSAFEVCSAFWQVAIGGEPPMAKPHQKRAVRQVPVSKITVPDHTSTQDANTPVLEPQPEPKSISPKPALQQKPSHMPDSPPPLPGQKKRQHLQNDWERIAFSFGLTSILIQGLCICIFIVKHIDNSDFYIALIYLGITVFRTTDLWDHGFPFHPSEGFLSKVSKVYSIFACVVHCLNFVISFVILASAGESTFSVDPEMNAWMIIYFLGIGIGSICHASWHIHKKKRSGHA